MRTAPVTVNRAVGFLTTMREIVTARRPPRDHLGGKAQSLNNNNNKKKSRGSYSPHSRIFPRTPAVRTKTI